MSRLICASCQGEGKLACKGCLLVLYCGADCQKKHWSVHKKDCKSPIGRDTWQPAWVKEGRSPCFIGDGPVGPPAVSFGTRKYLWGNMPAIDILKLEKNEGLEYGGELRILFAASGDLRNVVTTVASLPESFSNKLSITINDRDFDVVARNVILLLVAMVADDAEQASKCMIHLWYSAMISREQTELLQERVRRLVQVMCSKIADEAPGAPLATTWRFNSISLRLVLTKEQWSDLLTYFDTPEQLTPVRAHQVRTAFTMDVERKDQRDRAMFTRPPMHRLSAIKLREDGMLLPFGQSRAPFDQPNLTLFQSEDWPMMDSSDPLDGWTRADILRSPSGPATNDIYGKLFNYLNELFCNFHRRLKSLNVEFELFNVDAQKLESHLQYGSFARVEVSNISDVYLLGPARTVAHLGRFLQNPATNAHATLLTLFMNAVEEEFTQADQNRMLNTELIKVMQYIPLNGMPPSSNDPSFLMRFAACTAIRDNDKYFDRYMKKHRFKDFEQNIGIAPKERNTIIDKWPTRLKKAPTDKGAKEELLSILASAQLGGERYVEWKRTD